MKESILDLVEEMKELKIAEPTLELQEILRIFHIEALREQTNLIRRKP